LYDLNIYIIEPELNNDENPFYARNGDQSLKYNFVKQEIGTLNLKTSVPNQLIGKFLIGSSKDKISLNEVSGSRGKNEDEMNIKARFVQISNPVTMYTTAKKNIFGFEQHAELNYPIYAYVRGRGEKPWWSNTFEFQPSDWTSSTRYVFFQFDGLTDDAQCILITATNESKPPFYMQ
jgi:hypothetical protein